MYGQFINNSAFLLALLVTAKAAVLPASLPVEFQITRPNLRVPLCLAAESNANNAPVTVQSCNRTDLLNRAFLVDKGIGRVGPGPDTQIRLFDNKCLDVPDGLDQNGNKLQIFDCVEGNTNQLFNVNSDGTITWAGHNKCLDLTNGRFIPNNPVQIFDCIAGDRNQIWDPVLIAAPRGEQIGWNRNNVFTGVCITAAEDRDGAPVTIQRCGASPSPGSIFNVPAIDIGPLQVQGFDNKCLDVTDGRDSDGTKLQIFTCVEGNRNQLFNVDRIRGYGTRIMWADTNKCADLTDGKPTSGNPIQIWTCITGSRNQQWVERIERL